jgi:hypothetical protein
LASFGAAPGVLNLMKRAVPFWVGLLLALAGLE